MDNASYDATVAVLVEEAIKSAGQSVRGTAIATGIAYTTLDRKLKGAPFTVSELRRIGQFVGLPTAAFLPPETSRAAVAS